MNPETAEAVHVDFFNMPPTNEQQILATLLRIEVLLAGTKTAPDPITVPKGTVVIEATEERKGKIDALMNRTGTRRK